MEQRTNRKHLRKAAACPCPLQIPEWPVVKFKVERNLVWSARKLGLQVLVVHRFKNWKRGNILRYFKRLQIYYHWLFTVLTGASDDIVGHAGCTVKLDAVFWQTSFQKHDVLTLKVTSSKKNLPVFLLPQFWHGYFAVLLRHWEFFFFNWLLPPVMRPSMFNANKTTVLEGEVLLEGFMCLHTFEQFWVSSHF